jgi:hypothetical protein
MVDSIKDNVGKPFQHRKTKKRPWSPSGAWAAIVLVGCALGFAWGILCLMVPLDPWFGQQSQVICPRNCEGCHGPYVFHSWGSSKGAKSGRGNSNHLGVFCSHRNHDLQKMSWLERMESIKEFQGYEVPHGWLVIVGGGILLGFSISALIGLLMGLYLRLQMRKSSAK